MYDNDFFLNHIHCHHYRVFCFLFACRVRFFCLFVLGGGSGFVCMFVCLFCCLFVFVLLCFFMGIITIRHMPIGKSSTCK